MWYRASCFLPLRQTHRHPLLKRPVSRYLVPRHPALRHPVSRHYCSISLAFPNDPFTSQSTCTHRWYGHCELNAKFHVGVPSRNDGVNGRDGVELDRVTAGPGTATRVQCSDGATLYLSVGLVGNLTLRGKHANRWHAVIVLLTRQTSTAAPTRGGGETRVAHPEKSARWRILHRCD